MFCSHAKCFGLLETHCERRMKKLETCLMTIPVAVCECPFHSFPIPLVLPACVIRKVAS